LLHQYFEKPRVLRSIESADFESYLDSFAQELDAVGFAREHVRNQLRAAASGTFFHFPIARSLTPHLAAICASVSSSSARSFAANALDCVHFQRAPGVAELFGTLAAAVC
jgi:hypothetical protein